MPFVVRMTKRKTDSLALTRGNNPNPETNPMRYQFTCDARVSLEVEAETPEQACDEWDQFRFHLEEDDEVCRDTRTAHLVLLDAEPEVVIDPHCQCDRCRTERAAIEAVKGE